jgi:hypothetical protein
VGERDTSGRRQRAEPAGEQEAAADQRSEDLQDVAHGDPVLELLTPETTPNARSPVLAKPV